MTAGTDPQGDLPRYETLARHWEARPYLAELSITIASLDEGEARLTMPRNDVTVGGIRDSINGGVVASYAELAAEIALSTTLGPGEAIEGAIDVGLSYLTSALGETTLAVGRVLRKGGRICVCDVEVLDGVSGAINAKARVSYAITRPQRSS